MLVYYSFLFCCYPTKPKTEKVTWNKVWWRCVSRLTKGYSPNVSDRAKGGQPAEEGQEGSWQGREHFILPQPHDSQQPEVTQPHLCVKANVCMFVCYLRTISVWSIIRKQNFNVQAGELSFKRKKNNKKELRKICITHLRQAVIISWQNHF